MINSRQYTPSVKVFVIVLLVMCIYYMLPNLHVKLDKINPNYLRSSFCPCSILAKNESKIPIQDFASCFQEERAGDGSNCAKSLHLEQDSEALVSYVRKHHLIPPSPLPYNMTPFSSETFEAFKEPGNFISPQDKRVMEILNIKREGFFIEAGANDGLFRSNSLELERDYNWRGLLVEADPRPLSALVRRNRQAWVSDVCLSHTVFPSKMAMQRNKKVEAISRLVASPLGTPGDFESFEVNCFPLYTILLALGVSEIDYLSLDLEGLELDVLKTLPYDRINITVVSIEIHKSKRNPVTEFMASKGYTMDIHIHDNYNNDQLYVKNPLIQSG